VNDRRRSLGRADPVLDPGQRVVLDREQELERILRRRDV